MLQYLRISNLALLEKIELEFEGGFTAVTGETGAGKSVLLGALSLLAGNRAEKSIIRQGADACEVEGVLHFKDTKTIDTALEKLGLPACEDGALVLRRSLSRSKAARIHINGALATLAALETLGENWIDFHGPGEPQKLFKESVQLELLDAYARVDLSDYAADYKALLELKKQAEQARAEGKLSQDEIDFYRAQIEKIDALNPTTETIAELERDFSRLSHARELAELSSKIEGGLSGDGGVADALAPLMRAAAQLAHIDPASETLLQRLEALGIEAGDLAQEFSKLAEHADIDEESAQGIQNRMAAWLELKRKYGNEPDAIRQKRDEWEAKISRQSDLDGFLEKLAAEETSLLKRLNDKAAAIMAKRKKAAKSLAADVQDLLGQLGFKKADIAIEIFPLPELTATGNSRAEILFSPNPGTPALPLRKIASSGETARVMLALKTVLAQADHTPVLVFDEVDANVGGEIGAEVGRQLEALAKGHQVFCVTHLPQVAARAQSHFLVSKTSEDASTTVSISPIHPTPAARQDELARMLGDRSSKSAQAHAKELLKKEK